MKPSKEERACQIAVHMIESGATVRCAAKKFGISKSTVHKDLIRILPEISPVLYDQVRTVLDRNKAERHIRGGLATQKRYRSGNSAPQTTDAGSDSPRQQ